MTKSKSIIAFGGGINSIAMTILLVNEGWRGPIIFADTGGEWLDTYCYMDIFEAEFLKPKDLEITRLAPPGEYYTETQTKVFLEEWCRQKRTTPYCASRWCTVRWKIRPMARWMKKNGFNLKLIGLDAGEAHRIKNRPLEEYPLADRGIGREACKQMILGAGLPLPHKSSCFFCPFQHIQGWRELWERYPEFYERASELERLATERRGEKTTLDCGQRFTLDELRERRFELQPTLEGLDWENLREYQPCICGL